MPLKSKLGDTQLVYFARGNFWTRESECEMRLELIKALPHVHYVVLVVSSVQIDSVRIEDEAGEEYQ